MSKVDRTELRDHHRFFLDSMISIEETKTIIIKKIQYEDKLRESEKCKI